MADPGRLREYYRELDDEALLAAYRQEVTSYEPEAWAIVIAEINSRGLSPDQHEGQSGASPAVADEVEPVMSEADLTAALARARKQERQATWWIFGGLAVTAGTCAISERGGPYVIAWGAIAYGIVNAIRVEARIARLKRLQARTSHSAI